MPPFRYPPICSHKRRLFVTPQTEWRLLSQPDVHLGDGERLCMGRQRNSGQSLREDQDLSTLFGERPPLDRALTHCPHMRNKSDWEF